MRFVLYAILAYILYQFIFKLVIPVYQASKKIKKQFGEMQDRMQEGVRQQGHTPQSPETKPKQQPPKSDYIDFEEIR